MAKCNNLRNWAFKGLNHFRLSFSSMDMNLGDLQNNCVHTEVHKLRYTINVAKMCK